MTVPAPDDRTLDDRTLIDRCRGGDERAWTILVERYERLVYAIPRRCGLPADLADDVFQEVFATLLRRMDALRNPQGIGRWLITTTHRECWKRYPARAAIPAGADPPAGAPPPEAGLLDIERRQELHGALQRLGGRCEALLRAIFAGPEGRGYDAVARELDMPVGSIGPTRARCLAKLLAIMEEQGQTGGDPDATGDR
jgi:RNA polymerase sigma factor (sigma-70 family)